MGGVGAPAFPLDLHLHLPSLGVIPASDGRAAWQSWEIVPAEPAVSVIFPMFHFLADWVSMHGTE